jgi:hypothetical protein
MKFPVTRSISLLVATIFSSAALLLAAEKCNCPEPPGGGVKCTKGQIATCDPSKGVCDCTCDDAPKGKSRDEYLSIIFSRALDGKVKPTDLGKPEFQDLSKKFVDSETNGTFFILRKTDEGKTVRVTIGVPDWLVGQLKEGPKKMPMPNN